MSQTVLSNVMPKLGLSKKVLILGAGFVVKPTVQLLSDAGIDVTVACRTLSSAEKLSQGIANTHPISLDVDNSAQLDQAVAKVDLVVSLIPYTFHAKVIESAIREKKHVVTTSYVSDAMQRLDKQAKEAGITVMNEIGLDPGIDHLYAIKTIDEVHKIGGKITSFLSYCGGLPAPESSDNPLGYKFSWSSRGVLLALMNTAKFYQDGKVVEISGDKLMGTAKPYFIYPGYNFVAYANRDSTPYKERYNIPEAQTILRGTLRYGGFPEFVRTLVDTGLMDSNPNSFIKAASAASPPTWAETLTKILGSSSSEPKDLEWAIASRTKFADNEEKQRILAGLRWLGLFSTTERITPRETPLDTLCATLEKKMEYEAGERDFVILQHKFEIEWANGSKETRTSTLCEYGEPTTATSTSAMAKLVGIPCGIAIKMVLDGRISERGILAPLKPSIADPIREELLGKYGISMKEKTLL